MNTAITISYYVIVSLLIALVFVADCAGHYLIFNGGDHASWFTPITQRGNLVLLFLLGWSTALFGLLIDDQSVSRFSQWLLSVVKVVGKNLLDWRSYLVAISAALLIFFGRYLYSTEPLRGLVSQAVKQLRGIWDGLVPVLILFVAVVIVYGGLILLGRLLDKGGISVTVAYREWSAGSAILVGLVVLLAIGSLKIKIGSGDYPGIWRGMIKDYAIYVIILVFFVNGLTRWVACAQAVAPANRWMFFWVAVGVSILCALAALFLDHLYALGLEQGTVAKQLTESQRNRLIDFIHLRDYGILVPLCIVQLLYVFYRMMRLTALEGATSV